MYRSCLHCSSLLGGNEVIEAFPVGKRLAFDAARGRLWVICPRCSRWNLSPLEERWEAIEQCERLFRATRTRVSTDQVGLARAPDGTELVRIGEPQRPEFAAWRYGTVFRKRRKRAQYVAAASVLGAVTYAAGAFWGVTALGSIAPFLGMDIPWLVAAGRWSRRVVDRVETPAGPATIRGRDLGSAMLSEAADAGIAIRVLTSAGLHVVSGEPAKRLLARVMPFVNQRGGSEQQVQDALARIDAEGGPQGLIARCATRPRIEGDQTGKVLRPAVAGQRWSFASYQLEDLLALEMSLHEEQERRALEGELAALQDAWREAEEIAAIADALLVPRGVQVALSRIRDGMKR
ncbi:MAG: hypothetical protein JNJ98_13155 [Gemmatimonadetes bacterium]|nr:hypothetical protein [Gemmatimonadota bacterium]